MKIIFSPTKTMKKLDNEYESSTPNLELANKINEIYNVMGSESNQALFFYYGISFKYLDVLSLNKDDINYLTDNLFILSALYGVLRPLDLINEYRLDFSDKSLYKHHNIEINDTVINLASNEYSKMIKCSNMITIEFKIYKDNKLTSPSTYSKILRGLLLKYMAVNKIEDVDAIKNFNALGYVYNNELSNEKKFVYLLGNYEM